MENEASRKLAERLGFVQVGSNERIFHKEQGRVMRCGIFALELPK